MTDPIQPQIQKVTLNQIQIVIYVLKQHAPFLTHVETEYTKTGFGGTWGNKVNNCVNLFSQFYQFFSSDILTKSSNTYTFFIIEKLSFLRFSLSAFLNYIFISITHSVLTYAIVKNITILTIAHLHSTPQTQYIIHGWFRYSAPHYS